MTAVLSLPDAERLAEQTLAVIVAARADVGSLEAAVLDADRERVASDLAGLRECGIAVKATGEWHWYGEARRHARRYSDGLRRTAALYGVPTGRCTT